MCALADFRLTFDASIDRDLLSNIARGYNVPIEELWQAVFKRCINKGM